MAARKKDDVSLKPKLTRKEYEKELNPLQVELCQLQEWVKHSGQRVIILFEGRDGAAKAAPSRRSQSA
jgi:polyphosphate kinase 2 (PPK2 family)